LALALLWEGGKFFPPQPAGKFGAAWFILVSVFCLFLLVLVLRSKGERSFFSALLFISSALLISGAGARYPVLKYIYVPLLAGASVSFGFPVFIVISLSAALIEIKDIMNGAPPGYILGAGALCGVIFWPRGA
jgi:hypothetical protein